MHLMSICSKTVIVEHPCLMSYYTTILLTKTISAQNEVALSYHRVRGLYFMAVVFVATIVYTIVGIFSKRIHKANYIANNLENSNDNVEACFCALCSIHNTPPILKVPF